MALDLNKFGCDRPTAQLLVGWIEPLDVADLQDGPVTLREGDQLIRLGKIQRERLLRQHGTTAAQQVGRYWVMKDRRRHDADGVDVLGQIEMMVENADAVASGDLVGAGRVGVDDAHKLRRRQRREDSGMRLPK